MTRPFNPWAVPSDPFPPALLGSMVEGEVRYVSIEQVFVMPPPMGIFWISRAAPATQVQTQQHRTAIELKDGIYWVWFSGRDYQLVIEGDPTEPTVWAISLRIASDVTRPGVRPPADRPQPRRPSVADPRDPSSTAQLAPSYLVLLGTTDADPPSGGDDCEVPAEPAAAADCSQDATIQIDTSAATDTGTASPSHHAPHTGHVHHDPGIGHTAPDSGGWADGGGSFDGGGFSCGGGF